MGARLDPDALRATLQAQFRLLGLQGLVTIAIAGGLAYPPDRPGAGLEWDESAVRRRSVS